LKVAGQGGRKVLFHTGSVNEEREDLELLGEVG